MSSYRVELGRYALQHLDELWDYVADANSPSVADNVIGQIIDFCNEMAEYPTRGRARDDIHPGLRILGYKRRAAIASS